MSNEKMSADEVRATIDELIDVPVVECLEDEEFVEKAKRMRTAVAALIVERDALRDTLKRIEMRCKEHPDDTDADRKRNLYHAYSMAKNAQS